MRTLDYFDKLLSLHAYYVDDLVVTSVSYNIYMIRAIFYNTGRI